MPTRRQTKPSASEAPLSPSDDAVLLSDDGKNLAAVLLGRRGGLKGGHARAQALTAEQRSEIASLAARKRWGK